MLMSRRRPFFWFVAAVLILFVIKTLVCEHAVLLSKEAKSVPTVPMILPFLVSLCPLLTIPALTMIGTFATALIILRQADLLREQNRLSALIQLEQDWRSPRMRRLRTRCGLDQTDLESLESLLEFLEEFAGFHQQRVLNDQLVWDSTIGFHAAHYYVYSVSNRRLFQIREKWDDRTLFRQLRSFWSKYLREEIRNQRVRKRKGQKQIGGPEIRAGMRKRREDFWKVEGGLYDGD